MAVKASEEVAELEYALGEEKKKEWVEVDSDRVAPAGTMCDNARWHLAAELDPYLLDDDSSKKTN